MPVKQADRLNQATKVITSYTSTPALANVVPCVANETPAANDPESVTCQSPIDALSPRDNEEKKVSLSSRLE